jgi:hypothetical protein
MPIRTDKVHKNRTDAKKRKILSSETLKIEMHEIEAGKNHSQKANRAEARVFGSVFELRKLEQEYISKKKKMPIEKQKLLSKKLNRLYKLVNGRLGTEIKHTWENELGSKERVENLSKVLEKLTYQIRQMEEKGILNKGFAIKTLKVNNYTGL